MLRDVNLEVDAHLRVTRLVLSDEPARDHVEIDDAHFLFTAHFKKSGPDLILTGDDGRKLILVDYFEFAKHPDLVSHGATLSGDLVAHLAGPDAPGHYAQAGAPAGAQVIGKCERMGGSASVQHANGVVEDLNAGDAILKGDIVMTNDGSSLVLSLMDGTVFNLGASARMVLNEVVYDANSTSNSELISLVKGSFTFVAGQVAHTGNMMVDTPVAAIGIRGTTIGAYCEADPSGAVTECIATLLNDPGGGTGRYEILDRVTGAVVAVVTSTAVQVNLSVGANNQLLAQEAAKSPAIVQQELAAAGVLFPVYQAVQAQVPQPPGGPQGPQGPQQQQQNTSPPGGSLTPPQDQPQAQQETGSPENSNPATKIAEDATSITVQTGSAVLPLTTTSPTNQPVLLVTTPLEVAPSLNPLTITTPSFSTLEITSPSLLSLQEPGASQPGTVTSVATFSGSIDPAALASGGWIPSGIVPGSFQTNTAYGTVLLDPNNHTLTYSLNPLNPAVEALQSGQTLQDTVVVPTGANASTAVTFTIDGSAHPTGQNGTAIVNENLPVNPTQSVSGQLQATDPISTNLTYTAANPSGVTAHGTVQVNPDGTFIYTPTPGFYGTDSFQVQAHDGSYLASNIFTVTVNVNLAAPNDTAPVVGNIIRSWLVTCSLMTRTKMC